jgi:hypothetical protein
MARYGAMRHHHLPPVHAVAQEIRHGQYQKKINYFQQKRRSKTILEQVYGRTVITVIPGNMNIVYPSLTHFGTQGVCFDPVAEDEKILRSGEL